MLPIYFRDPSRGSFVTVKKRLTLNDKTVEKSFWKDSWDEGGYKTSFHKLDVHAYLFKHLPPPKLSNKKVLIPLCGKSVDLIYFREYAAQVIGVEFIHKAVNQFFEEQKLPFTKAGNFFLADKLTIINSDFFNVSVDDIGHIDLIYDRACLVALPPQLRFRYIQKIEELLPMGSQQFINTLEYFPTKLEPPFSIPPTQVRDYYGYSHHIEHVESENVENHGLKRAWGLEYVKEHGFLATKNHI